MVSRVRILKDLKKTAAAADRQLRTFSRAKDGFSPDILGFLWLGMG
jgi:hypothetical protein